MKRLLIFGISALALLALPGTSRAVETPRVIISEVAWAGSSVNASDEWLELANLTGESVDLTGWSIDAAATGGESLPLPDGAVIAPHSVYLIANYAQTHANSALARTPDHATSTLALSNSALGLVLRDAGGNPVDLAGNGGRPFAGRTLGSGDVDGPVSMVRSDDSLAGDLAEAWTDATASDGFKDSMSDLGTPGIYEVVSGDAEPDSVVEEVTEEEQVVEEEEPMVAETEEEEEIVEVVEAEQVVEEETIEEKPTALEEEPSAPLPVHHPHGTLIINELLPSPADGEDEFVEILNPFNNVIDLTGWTIVEGSGKATALPEQLLGFGQMIVIKNPAGKLNNSGDTVVLKDPSGAIIDEMIYGTDALAAPKKGMSLSLGSDGFVATEPTPGEPNIFPAPPEPAPEPEPAQTDLPVHETKTVLTTTVGGTPPASVMQPAVMPATPFTLKLWEIYANAGGNDAEGEFIELKNVGSEPIDAKGLVLEDRSGKRFVLAESVLIPPAGFLTLFRPQTGITLNNDADTVRLYAPDGRLTDLKAYEKQRAGTSLAREGDDWHEGAQPTPGSANVFAPPPSLVEPKTVAKAKPAAAKKVSTVLGRTTSARDVTVAVAKTMPDGARVRVEGIVTARPDIVGKQVFYVTDATGSLQIYKNDALFPALAEGDRVEILGELSTAGGVRRLKITKDGTLTVLGAGEVPAARTLSLADAAATGLGALVRVSGTIVSRSEGTIVLETEDGEVTVRMRPAAGIDASALVAGTNISVAGILTKVDPVTLNARTQDDIRIEPPAAAGATDVPLAGKAVKAAGDRTAGLVLLAAVFLTLAALAAKTYLPKYLPYAKRHPLGVAPQKAS